MNRELHFIERAKEIHGNKYDYSNLQYKNYRTKVRILCHQKDEKGIEHGEFWQLPSKHITSHQGCPKCRYLNRARKSTDTFIQQAKEVHGDKYNYDKVEYTKSSEKVCIICPEHGEFWQIATDHIQGRGCPKCGRIATAKKLTKVNTLELSSTNIEECVKNPKIVNKDQIIGTVYCFINSINNKKYIGKTVRSSYLHRLSDHKYEIEHPTNNYYFYRALRKYRWDNFNIIILFQTQILDNTENNKKILDNLVLEKEKYYISRYQTNNPEFGYNLTDGGDGIVGFKFSKEAKQKMSQSRKNKPRKNNGNLSQPVLQFDLDFNFIKEWPSAAEIERQLGYKASQISRCCNNNLDTYKKYIWVKKSNYFDGYLQQNKSHAKYSSKAKSVLQYTLDGTFIAEYPSCKAAKETLNLTTSISKAAAGTQKQSAGYIWIYKSDYTEELLKLKINKLSK